MPTTVNSASGNPTTATTTNTDSSTENINPQPAAPATLEEKRAAWSVDGFNDGELQNYFRGIIGSNDPQSHVGGWVSAILNPTLPKENHDGQKFFEVLAWYVDKSTQGRGDGKLTGEEVQEMKQQYMYEYHEMTQGGTDDVARMQKWKFIQKLTMLEKVIENRASRGEGAYYPYSARAMMTIGASDFNRTNTIDTRTEFNERVIEASYDKPVLVKFGLTYCAHCLLLEQLGSVPAVAEKYADAMDVYKLWWNPHDEAMAEITAVAGEQGVTSSPLFILYKDGEIVKSGYGFPDENGEGLEDFLAGHIEDTGILQ
ncbi:MAG: thioredoxin family protein [Myxococcota bacterium]|nr:thioredoxin family protein [Myxococcota bacterium]